jgi:hypothetical protein
LYTGGKMTVDEIIFVIVIIAAVGIVLWDMNKG